MKRWMSAVFLALAAAVIWSPSLAAQHTHHTCYGHDFPNRITYWSEPQALPASARDAAQVAFFHYLRERYNFRPISTMCTGDFSLANAQRNKARLISNTNDRHVETGWRYEGATQARSQETNPSRPAGQPVREGQGINVQGPPSRVQAPPQRPAARPPPTQTPQEVAAARRAAEITADMRSRVEACRRARSAGSRCVSPQ
jgi:hypothetical protein